MTSPLTEALRRMLACPICAGAGRVEVGTGYPSDAGGEMTEVIDCECVPTAALESALIECVEALESATCECCDDHPDPQLARTIRCARCAALTKLRKLAHWRGEGG